jgi:hypothetical protein
VYSIDDVVAVLHAHPGLMVFLAFATYAFGFAQYITSMVMQQRNKDCPFFFWQHAWYFGHDLTFVLLFHQWFYQVDFWLFRVLWAGCVAFVGIEIYSLYLTVKNERQAVWGRFYDGPVSVRTGWLRGIALYAIGLALFWTIRAAIGDVMCLVLMMSTNATLAIATQFKLETNKVRQPGSVWLGWFIVLGTILTFAPPGVGFFATAVAALDEPWFYALGAVSVVCAVRYLVVALRQRRLPLAARPDVVAVGAAA